ncbi:hypothetical protein ABD83_03110 [Bacillus xiamenensis]|uniref:PIG-L family deacetylase n=1 Tax=Bacillus xiamenensis TaxID=1178537 RepID=A0ABT4F4M9_9BACI|nr:PIG-L family deacetylase [Bacillus xiamenensis]MBG9910476.1 hypothetical protein [Bacillus xiamenensis]MCY9576981.1 PIG-L family deacetylase [Bacillus xiamenensis]
MLFEHKLGKCYFFSPHYDDAALSCGGTIAKWITEGADVYIVNLFTQCKSDHTNLSPLATQYLKEDLNKTALLPLDALKWRNLRKREDEAGLASLGVKSQHIIDLNMNDAIFRSDDHGYFYPGETSLFQNIHPKDIRLFNLLLREIQKLSLDRQDLLFFPSAEGGHIDHQLAFKCGLHLSDKGFLTFFYEEFPYSLNHENSCAFEEALYQKIDVSISQSIEAKRQSILQYKSQMTGLFQSEEQFLDIFQKCYMESGHVERFWKKRGKEGE